MNPGHFANRHFANGHFAKMSKMDISPTYFPPLDKVDGVEYTYKSCIISQCSVKDATLAVIKFQALYLP